VRLTNTFGTQPLQIGSAAIGVAGSNGAISGPDLPLTFGGQSSVLIPPGAEVLSDPISLQVLPLEDLAVSVYVPQATGPATNHSDAQQDNYVATGDESDDPSGSAFTTQTQSWYFVDSVDVTGGDNRGTVVAFGDSITDGYQSTVDANRRWPNDLARRLDALSGPSLSVADEGISGNRVLNDSLCCGVNAQARFERDVVERAGAKDVILLEGINDIGFSQLASSPLTNPNTNVSAAQIIAGYEQLIADAHAGGLKIFGATLTPFRGASYWSAQGELKREAVNKWILTSGAFDGVIDFAKAVAEPGDPQVMNPAFDSGDHLHPNDAGYQAMANAIDLSMLTGS
jgi:lysophospholipase L1-like esterase